MTLRRRLTGALLRRLRVLEAAGAVPADPYAPEYLYLVQQSKRLSLARTLGHFRWKNLPLWPVLVAAVLVKWADLALANALIRSLINEYDLLQRVASSGERDGR